MLYVELSQSLVLLTHNRSDVCENLVFSDRSSTKVEHDPNDEIRGYSLPTRMPDRVFGLNVTRQTRRRLQAVPRLRHTPFSESSDIMYPFFISEAKQGGQNPGFRSIDLQTAFPIRSCLMLQKRLRELSSNKLDPLVWYVPYIGDRWMLSACILHEDEVVSREESLAKLQSLTFVAVL